MHNCKWIADSGNCNTEELIELVAQKMLSETAIFLAMMTDRFYSAAYNDENMKKINWNNLLEIRVFNEKEEFLATRGGIGEGFSWRITSDDEIDEMDRIVTKQFIDINENETNETTQNGLEILSTVGGGYYLPISKTQKRIKVMSYLKYDANGMAKVVDSRICCFTE